MLNFHLLFSILNPRYKSRYLAILCCLGIAVLLDIILCLQLAFLIGPWIFVSLLSVLTAFSVLLVYYLVDVQTEEISHSIRKRVCDESVFTSYIATLLIGVFLLLPGLINTLIGGILLIPFFSRRIGKIFLVLTGIRWEEAHEYLKLNDIADSQVTEDI